MHEEKMRPDGRISTYILSANEMFGRISIEQRVASMLQRLCGRGVEHGMLPHQFPTYGPLGESKGNANYIKIRWVCGWKFGDR